ncbi:MAG: hypothetical protein AB7O52_07765 [Planctomycetota bacterium]
MLRIVARSSVFVLALGVVCPIAAQQPTLGMGSVEVLAGESFAVDLTATWFEEVQGYSLSISFPPTPPIVGLDIIVDNTLVGALDPDFVQANIFASAGEAVLGVLIDSAPPFGEPLLQPVGLPLAIAEIVGTIPVGTAAQTIPFTYVDGLGSPATDNRFVIDNQSVTPAAMTGGTVQVNEPVSTVPVFIRGDAYLNGILDISDIIFLLFHIFVAGPQPLCRDAADANDSGTIDVSDAVFMINYLFSGGPNPLAPFPTPGPDPSADSLSCAVWIQ